MKICHSQKKDIAKEIIGDVSKKDQMLTRRKEGKTDHALLKQEVENLDNVKCHLCMMS